MKVKNKLSKLAYEVLIERKLQSFTLIEVRDLLLKKYKDEFSEEELYKHLHRQFSKLYEVGYLARDSEKKNVFFSVTDKFYSSQFEQANSTRLFGSDDEIEEEALILNENKQKNTVQINTKKPSRNLNENKKSQPITDKMEVSMLIPKSFLSTEDESQEVILSIKLR